MSSVLAPIHLNAKGIDLSSRVQRTGTVVASPAGATETIVASLTLAGNLQIRAGVYLLAMGAYTVGTNGVSVNLKVRKTDTSGTTLKATGAIDIAATKLGSGTVITFDASPSGAGQIYVLTATVASGTAETTFSAVEILAIVV